MITTNSLLKLVTCFTFINMVRQPGNISLHVISDSIGKFALDCSCFTGNVNRLFPVPASSLYNYLNTHNWNAAENKYLHN